MVLTKASRDNVGGRLRTTTLVRSRDAFDIGCPLAADQWHARSCLVIRLVLLLLHMACVAEFSDPACEHQQHSSEQHAPISCRYALQADVLQIMAPCDTRVVVK
jgi:hypothetical protein